MSVTPPPSSQAAYLPVSLTSSPHRHSNESDDSMKGSPQRVVSSLPRTENAVLFPNSPDRVQRSQMKTSPSRVHDAAAPSLTGPILSLKRKARSTPQPASMSPGRQDSLSSRLSSPQFMTGSTVLSGIDNADLLAEKVSEPAEKRQRISSAIEEFEQEDVSIQVDEPARLSSEIESEAQVAPAEEEVPVALELAVPRQALRARIYQHDRFIPSSLQSVLSRPGAAVYNTPRSSAPRTSVEYNYRAELANAIFGSRRDPYDYPILRNDSSAPYVHDVSPRIPATEIYTEKAERSLDFPGIVDDFYSMPAAHSSESDRIACIMGGQAFVDASGAPRVGTQIYLYNSETKAIQPLFSNNALYLEGSRPISVAFNVKGNCLVVGKKDGNIETWSLNGDSPVKIREVSPAAIRGISPAKINSVVILNHKILAGDQLGRVYQIDPKAKTVLKLSNNHRGAICNIVVSPNGRYIATGGNDNQVIIRNAATLEVLNSFRMNAGIRAIAFDPEGGPRIAVGGGHTDPRICIFNFLHPEQEKMIEMPVDSQVTNILWPKRSRLITTHRNGTYGIVPIKLGGKSPMGPMKSIHTQCGRILFSGILEKSDKKTLVCAGSNELISFFPLPKERVNQSPSTSIFDDPRYTVR